MWETQEVPMSHDGGSAHESYETLCRSANGGRSAHESCETLCPSAGYGMSAHESSLCRSAYGRLFRNAYES